jgi:Tfp pilus assembly protein PilO
MAEGVSISDWLKKAKEDPKLALQPFLIIGAVAFMGYKFLYAPKTIEIAKELKKSKGVADQIKKVETAIENIEDIKLNIEERKAKWTASQKLCYRKSEMTSFLRRVRELAQKAGIEVKSVNPQPISQMQVGQVSVEKFPVSFFYTGDLVTIATFLRLVELEEKISFLSIPHLLPNASGSFEVEFVPTTILVPDQMVTTGQ